MTAQKILLADDSVTIRKVVELTFADEGIEVVSVSDGDAAMAKFVEILPDMVIADVHMPGMNGYQICESIKSREATRHIPVILLVGSFEPFDPGEASRVGANYYFTKPFHSIRELVEKVSEYLALAANSEPNKPETADIEHLYNQSFQDTLEMPDTNEEVNPDQPSPETVRVDGNRPFDTAETADTEPEGGDPASPADNVFEQDEMEVNEAPFGSIAPNNFPESEKSNPAYESFSEPVDRAKVATASVAQELGDAGMDDDIIETTHPNIPDLPMPVGRVVNPFDERVDSSSAIFPREGISLESNFDWRAPDITSAEPPVNAITDNTPLKFVLDDNETATGSDSGYLHVAPREGSEASASSPTEANISPEVIETIVRTVLERLSDRAVREAAQEAVPRIAEKLIREALDEDYRK